MRAQIHTSGFFIDTTTQFGIKDWDEYRLDEGGLVILSKNGRYEFTKVQVVDEWVIVFPQQGEYEGPSNGLGHVYGFCLRIDGVWDIESSLGDSPMTGKQYQAARVAAGLEPVESYPFPKWVPPYAGHVIGDYIEVDEFTEMEETA